MEPRKLFGLSDHLEALSKHGDPREVLDATVDFECFRGWPVDSLGHGGGSTQVFCEGGGALLTPRDVHHGQPGSPAQFDRPLPLALKLG